MQHSSIEGVSGILSKTIKNLSLGVNLQKPTFFKLL